MRQTYFTPVMCIFLAGVFMKVKSQTEPSIGSHTTSETERCVCQPRVTINPPVCGRSIPVNSGTGCNCTTVHEILRTVSTNQEDTRRQVDEFQVAVSQNQETVSSELQAVKRQLEMLQSAVASIVGLLKDSDSFPKDCSAALVRGMAHSGVYTIQPLDSGGPVDVYCDMETDGGGWTVFQRRQDGSVDFYLDFANYSRGFGNLEGEFWLGNDNLHRLTAQGNYTLRVDLASFDNDTAYAVYDSFSIADVSDNYRLTVGSYSGTAGDSLSYNNNQTFSTKDTDNDEIIGANCAVQWRGAWWYVGCSSSSLNGRYLSNGTGETVGVLWTEWNKGGYFSLKYTDMKVRLNC